MNPKDLEKLCNVIYHIDAAEKEFASTSKQAQGEVRAEYAERLKDDPVTGYELVVWLFSDVATEIAEMSGLRLR